MLQKPIIIKKGIVQPSFGKKTHNSFTRVTTFAGGVFTDTGAPVTQSKTIIYEREIVTPIELNLCETDVKYIDEDVIYFSVPQNHFGHVLTGTMTFAYILLNDFYKNHKIVFIDKEPCNSIKILLGHLNVKEENIFTINENTQFRSVVVAESSLPMIRLSRFRKRLFEIYPEFLDTFKVISQQFVDSNNPKKIYFSRRKFSGRPILFEEKIERIFEKNGYKIFYPEQLPLNEQIKLVANADFYVCLQGTLEHHCLFMKDGATLIVMARKGRRTIRQIWINKLQTNINHIYLRANIQPFGDKVSPNIVGISSDFIPFFNEYNFIYDVEDLKMTNQEINDYTAKCSWRDIPLPKFVLQKILKYFLLRNQKFIAKITIS